jgi:hypothetical protein
MCFQSSPMTLMHLVSGPHFENHCFGTGSQSCVHVGSTGELANVGARGSLPETLLSQVWGVE